MFDDRLASIASLNAKKRLVLPVLFSPIRQVAPELMGTSKSSKFLKFLITIRDMNIGSQTSLFYLPIFYPSNPKTKTPSLIKKMGFSLIASWTSLSVRGLPP
jgi:hypothetical protein